MVKYMEFISKLKKEDFIKVSGEIYEISKFLSVQYPDYENWFKQKVLKRIKNGTGEIIYVRNEKEIEGFIIAKNTYSEKKICTVFIKEEYRGIGLGSKLIEEAIVYLEDLRPLITIPENKVSDFKYFINRYKWIKTSISNKYNSPEIIFNEK